MTRRNEMLGLSILTGAIVMSILVCRHQYVAGDEFKGLFVEPSTSHLVELVILGQQRRVDVKEAEMLKLFEQAFHNPATVPANGSLGVSYLWIFRFQSGRSFSTWVSLPDDKTVFYISDTTDIRASDANIKPCSFQQPLSPKLSALLDKLLYFPPVKSGLTGVPTPR